MTPEEILNVVLEIQEQRSTLQAENASISEDDIKRNIMERHQDFAMNHPATFISSAEGTLDIEKMRYMVGMANKVRNKKISQHDASVEIGTRLVDQYVKPVLDKKSK